MSSPIEINSIYPPDRLVIPGLYVKDLKGVLVPEGLIKDRVSKLAEEISSKHYPNDLLAVCVLDGAMRFFVDLLYNEHMLAPVTEVETLKAKSYEGKESTGKISISGFDFSKVKDKRVILVEDILDTGTTLDKVTKEILVHNPKCLEVACLLDKPSRRVTPVNVDYCGFVIPNEFVVGFGLDFNGNYRGLKHICVLKEEVYRTEKK